VPAGSVDALFRQATKRSIEIPGKHMKPVAEFIGYQEDGLGGRLPLYNVRGGRLHGSTVGADTLAAEGIRAPSATAR
jgi:hypothetical protein